MDGNDPAYGGPPMTPSLPHDAAVRLHSVPDEWQMQPSEWTPSAIVRSLKAVGYLMIKRERPVPGSPYRYHLKRTPEGRAALGLEVAT